MEVVRMGVPVPKPSRTTPEQRRAEKRQRDHNPFKPVFSEHTREVTAEERLHDRFKVDGSSLHSVSRQRLAENQGRIGYSTFDFRVAADRIRRPLRYRPRTQYWKTPGRNHEWTDKARKRLRQVGERVRRYAAPDAHWRKAVHAVWGSCLLTGATVNLQAHHTYPKQSNPDKRWDVPNGITFTEVIHKLIHSIPGALEACQKVADEAYAAEAGRRPPVTRTGARQIMFQYCSELRKYARPEPDEQ